MTIRCLVGTEEQVIAANTQIEKNLNIPKPGTDRWSIPEKMDQNELWFIFLPEVSWNEYSKEQAAEDTLFVTEMDFQYNWRKTISFFD